MDLIIKYLLNTLLAVYCTYIVSKADSKKGTVKWTILATLSFLVALKYSKEIVALFIK